VASPSAQGAVMNWVPRELPKIDRIACPRLIRRFIDQDAEILYVPTAEVLRVAKHQEAIPFDVPGVELTHDGPEASLDAILKKNGLDDPALARLAAIVRARPRRCLRCLKRLLVASWMRYERKRERHLAGCAQPTNQALTSR
jgi:hypothetical protein